MGELGQSFGQHVLAQGQFAAGKTDAPDFLAGALEEVEAVAVYRQEFVDAVGARAGQGFAVGHEFPVELRGERPFAVWGLGVHGPTARRAR